MSLVFSREVGFRDKHDSHPHPGRSAFSEQHARRLVVDEVLEGHDGCVNRLAWNEHGTRLASASDDCRIILWRYPSGGLVPLGLRTEHTANIFGVEFLPGTDDRLLVSGAMDGTVQLHQLDGLQPPRPPPPLPAEDGSAYRGHADDSNPRIPFVQPHTTVFRCHSDRVKDVAVQAGDPHLFWSAAEDGTVRQYDRRIPGQNEPTSSNALLWLNERASRSVSCKSINVCQAQPHLLALACGDPWVRIFDRRRLGPVSLANARAQSQPLLKLCPPHLLPGPVGADGRLAPRCHTTCASFSARGDKVVATYYADHAYIYDITGAGALHAPLAPPGRHACSHTQRQASSSQNNGEEDTEEQEAGPQRPEYELCHRIRHVSVRVDAAANQEEEGGNLQQLLLERAQLLMERGWRGDAAWAVKDLEDCLEAVPDHCEARRFLVEALAACGQSACAAAAAEDWLERFPGAEGAPEVRERRHRLHTLVRRRQGQASNGRGSDPAAEAEREREREMESSGEGPEQDDSWLQACAMDSWWPFYHRSTPSASEPAGPSSSSPGSSIGNGSSPRQPRSPQAPNTGGPLGRGSVWRGTAGGQRVVGRLVGQQNLHTDIKEAAFLGAADALVATGSDDGYVYLYCAESGEPLVALKADEDVANCCKPHPHHPVLATSGIENAVRLWAPGVSRQAGQGVVKGRALERLVVLNQQSLQDGGAGHGFGAVLQQHSDLVRVVLRSLASAAPPRRGEAEGGDEEDEEVEVEYPCRVS